MTPHMIAQVVFDRKRNALVEQYLNGDITKEQYNSAMTTLETTTKTAIDQKVALLTAAK